jgi:hypothetical protein
MIFTKRRKFVLSSALLSLGLLVTSFVPQDWRYFAIALLGIFSVFFTIWALWEDLSRTSWLFVPILPAFYSSSVALFYFLLPEKLLTRIVILILFGVGMYAIFLTENIFSVASIRTIQLARAAQAVGFLLTLLTAFFIFDTIFSFKLSPWWNALLIFGASFPLVLQGIWSVKLEEKISLDVLTYSLVIAWGMMQISFMISFWPVTIVIASIFLVTTLYISLGITQYLFAEKLFKETIREYVQVGVIIFILALLVARWGG